MARQVNGFVGNFTSLTELNNKYPPAEHAGCSANFISNGITVKYWSNGTAWGGGDPVALQALVSGARNLRQAGALVTDWGAAGTISTTGSTGTGYSATLDATVMMLGKPALKCVFPSDASAQTFIATWTPANPISLRAIKTLHVPVMFTSSNAAGGVGNAFQVWLQTSDSKSIRLQMTWASSATPGYQGGVWQTFVFARGANAITGDPMSSLDTAGVTVTSIKIVQATTGAAAAANPVWVGEIRADAARQGRVSIVMDGEYISQYSQIYPMMQRLGLVGSLALVGGNIGYDASVMTAAQISDMYAAGWECIHHTYDRTKTGGYVNSTDWPTAASISDDIRAGFSLMAANGWTRGLGYAVWGYNVAFDQAQTQARQNLVRDGFRGGGVTAIRASTPYNQANYHPVSLVRMPIDPFVVRGVLQVQASSTPSDIIAAIDLAENTGCWSIITLHRSVLDSATPSGLEMRIGDLTTGMQYLASRVAAGGVVNAPFGQTFGELLADRAY